MSFSHKPVERKKPRSKPPPSESQKRFQITDEHDEDNMQLSEEEIVAQQEAQNRKVEAREPIHPKERGLALTISPL